MFSLIYLFLLLNCCLFFVVIKSDDSKIQCKPCQLLVRSFVEGLEYTENHHFGGGNTDWEERNLGRFMNRFFFNNFLFDFFSEIRFVEAMEFACRKNTNAYKDLEADSDLQFKVNFVKQEKEIKKPLNKAKSRQNTFRGLQILSKQ